MDLLKKVGNQLLGGGGGSGGGGDATGDTGITGIDWLDQLLGLGATGLSGYESGQEAEAQRDWLTEMYAPQKEYQQGQLDLFKDVFSPLTKQLGGELGNMFSADNSGISNASWTQGRNRIEDYYGGVEQKASEVFAGSNMLGSGISNKYFTEELPGMKAKSMEDLAVDQVLNDYNMKNTNISQMLSFLGKTPSVSTVNQPYTSTNINWGELLKGIISPTNPIIV